MISTKLLLTLLAFGLPVFLACPPGSDTWYDGFCLFTYTSEVTWTQTQAKCNNNKAKLISIHSETENDYINRFSGSSTRGYWIGLRCDEAKKKFYWEDSTVFDYNNFADASTTCNNSTLRFYQKHEDGKWYTDPNWSYYTRPSVCKKIDRPEDSLCEEFEQVPNTKECVQLVDDSKTAEDAEKECVKRGAHLASIHEDKVNDYIRRSAVARNLTNGVLIGLKQASNDSSAFSWFDGTIVDYKHFAAGLPNYSLGNRFAMQTGSIAGDWVNIAYPATDAYACSMPAYDFPFPAKPKLCPTANFSDGEVVQVRVDFFETNACCDTLTIFEGVAGDKKIATLAGSTFNSKMYSSSLVPALRLVYSASSGAHVRGWQLTVKAKF